MPWPGAGTHVVIGSTAEIRARCSSRMQARGGQHERVVFAGVELAQPRIEVAANRSKRGARKQSRKLRRPPDAARADARRAAKPRRSSSIDVAACSVCAFEPSTVGGQDNGVARHPHAAAPRRCEVLGKYDRHVLAAVDGEIDLAGEQRVLDFLHEQSLAANLRQRCFGQRSPEVRIDRRCRTSTPALFARSCAATASA